MRAPPSRVLESAPFDGASVSKSDYPAHRGARPAPLLRPEARSTVGGEEQRDFQSENAANYKAHGQRRCTPHRLAAVLPVLSCVCACACMCACECECECARPRR
jgi:hypothetical protein